MDIALLLIAALVGWHLLRQRYQREHITLLGKHLNNLQLERHMESLTQGYARAINEDSERRQRQVLDAFTQTEQAEAAHDQTLSDAVQADRREAESHVSLIV